MKAVNATGPVVIHLQLGGKDLLHLQVRNRVGRIVGKKRIRRLDGDGWDQVFENLSTVHAVAVSVSGNLSNADSDLIIGLRHRTGLPIYVVSDCARNLVLLVNVPGLNLYATNSVAADVLPISKLVGALRNAQVGDSIMARQMPTLLIIDDSPNAVRLLPEHMSPATKQWLTLANAAGACVVWKGAVLRVCADVNLKPEQMRILVARAITTAGVSQLPVIEALYQLEAKE
jgi:hypothetical protein